VRGAREAQRSGEERIHRKAGRREETLTGALVIVTDAQPTMTDVLVIVTNARPTMTDAPAIMHCTR
jgi:hypothetical protein